MPPSWSVSWITPHRPRGGAWPRWSGSGRRFSAAVHRVKPRDGRYLTAEDAEIAERDLLCGLSVLRGLLYLLSGREVGTDKAVRRRTITYECQSARPSPTAFSQG